MDKNYKIQKQNGSVAAPHSKDTYRNKKSNAVAASEGRRTTTSNVRVDNNNNEVTNSTTTTLPRWYPHHHHRWGNNDENRPWFHGNPEALGWAFDSIGRAAAFVGTAAFLGTALLTLSKEAAGCDITEVDPTTGHVPLCEKRVYGIRPSSLLTTYTIVVGVFSTALLPLIGAIVDYTPYRRFLGRSMSAAFCGLTFPQIFISDKTWFAVALLQLCTSFVGWAQTMVAYAYLPELTNCEDRLNDYTKSFSMLSFGTMVLFLLFVIVVASFFGYSEDTVATAQTAMATSFIISSVFLYLAWGHLMKERPAARQLPSGQSLWSAGFVQVYTTSQRIYRELPALKWFYTSVAFIDAGINALVTIMITYLTDTLNFTSTETGIAMLLLLLGSVPGAYFAGKTTSLFNPIYSSLFAVIVLISTTIVASILLTGPHPEKRTYVHAGVWGIAIGWKWTTDRLMASTLIPPGQEAELMGMFLFSGQVLTWLPPLVFTIMNERGVSQRMGIGLLCVYFSMGIVCLLFMGDYREAVEQKKGGDDSLNHHGSRGRLRTESTTTDLEDMTENGEIIVITTMSKHHANEAEHEKLQCSPIHEIHEGESWEEEEEETLEAEA